MELNKEEQYIIQKWRELPEWGVLEARKSNGALFEVESRSIQRVKSNFFIEEKV